jgi:tryptophan-rich sensory protein
MKKINWFQLLLLILGAQTAGALGRLFSGNIGETYASFIKPPLSPPGWMFGIVWPLLYLLMAIAAYLIHQSPSPLRGKAIAFYWVQLAVNFIWPIVFFGSERYWVSVAIILVLDMLVFSTTILFCKIKKPAAWLMLPYLLWILFATYLNIAIALLNQ